METNASFVRQLLQFVPELKPVHEHVENNYGGLLAHVFMAEVTRFAIAETGRPESRAVLARLIEQLELGLAKGSEQVQELITVSFVEHLCGQDALKILTPMMGPRLRKELEAVGG